MSKIIDLESHVDLEKKRSDNDPQKLSITTRFLDVNDNPDRDHADVVLYEIHKQGLVGGKIGDSSWEEYLATGFNHQKVEIRKGVVQTGKGRQMYKEDSTYAIDAIELSPELINKIQEKIEELKVLAKLQLEKIHE